MKFFSSIIVGVAVLACVGAAGCAAESSETIEETSDALGEAVSVSNPSGAYFASIRANGTGCPAGTWGADISPDGKAFTVTFSAYEAMLDTGKSFAIKDCTLSIDLRTPDGYSFSVSNFYYQGYAILDQAGMSAKQTAKYYFMGNPIPAADFGQEITGPYDDSYIFSNPVGIVDQVWSPCGTQRTLNAQTRLVLRNNPARTGSAYLNTSSIDGDVDTVFRFALDWKRCDGATPGPAQPPPPAPIALCQSMTSGELASYGDRHCRHAGETVRHCRRTRHGQACDVQTGTWDCSARVKGIWQQDLASQGKTPCP